MLAGVLGTRVEANPVKEIGNYDLHLTDAGLADPLFDGFEPTFPAFQWHGDTFRVPHGIELLVRGADCRNQAFRKDRQVAVQFHLETTPADAAVYCRAYPDELREIDKTRERVMADITHRAETLKRLNYRLLDNFLNL
jgi:GMP synthase-like glutamine amidotransferase